LIALRSLRSVCVGLLLTGCLLGGLPACLVSVPSLENAEVAGRWSLTVKNEDDNCMFEGWTAGGVGTFEIVMNQFGEDRREVNARLDGLLGLALWLGLGTQDLSGVVEGDELSLTMFGARDETASTGCVFRREIRVKTRIEGDRLRNGEIIQRPRPISGTGCERESTCRALQSFDGVRVGAADAATRSP